MSEFDFCQELTKVASSEGLELFDYAAGKNVISIAGDASFDLITKLAALIKQKERKENKKYKSFKIPDYVLSLPDDALLNSAEIMSILGYSRSSSASTMIEKGRVPKPDVKIRRHKNGNFILNWSVGYIKKLSSQ